MPGSCTAACHPPVHALLLDAQCLLQVGWQDLPQLSRGVHYNRASRRIGAVRLPAGSCCQALQAGSTQQATATERWGRGNCCCVAEGYLEGSSTKPPAQHDCEWLQVCSRSRATASAQRFTSVRLLARWFTAVFESQACCLLTALRAECGH